MNSTASFNNSAEVLSLSKGGRCAETFARPSFAKLLPEMVPCRGRIHLTARESPGKLAGRGVYGKSPTPALGYSGTSSKAPRQHR